MGTKLILILAILLGGVLSFLSIGLIWTGINQWSQAVITLLFFGLSFFASKKTQFDPRVLGAILIGAAPLGGIVTLFRDKNNSHLLGFAIVASWIIASYLGARRPAKANNSVP
jgi:hypothetical protein